MGLTTDHGNRKRRRTGKSAYEPPDPEGAPTTSRTVINPNHDLDTDAGEPDLDDDGPDHADPLLQPLALQRALRDVEATVDSEHVRLQGRLDESEQAMRAVFDRASRLRDEGQSDALEWMGLSRWELGEIAFSRGEPGLALGMFQDALGELEEAGMPSWDPTDWERRTTRLKELESR